MNDWQALVDYAPWFLKPGEVVRVSEPSDGISLSHSLAELFPSLSILIAQASVTRVSIDETPHLLLGWDGIDGSRIGWLCLPPDENPPEYIHPDHAKLLRQFGGILERFNEPEDTWLLNHYDVLTAKEAANDASIVNDYSWAFEDAGLEIPIRPADFYSIAREANSNCTLCHRKSGEVILFAGDHDFDHVELLKGCPERTLYKLSGIISFQDWVNAIANQWLSNVAKSV